MILEEINNIKETKRDLRKFGFSVGIVIALIGVLLFYSDRASYFYFWLAALLLLIPAAVSPSVLRPLNKIWMTFAIILGWFMTRVILSILFYFVLTPIGWIAKIIGKEFLDINWKRKSDSYWIKRKKINMEKIDYERQF
jgi:multisubunit Na+/H+ antiporter MnhG subunit